MKVDYAPFSYAPRDLKSRWLNEITKVIEDGQFIGGKWVSKFEDAWSQFSETSNSIGVSNGMDGLTLALRSLNIGKGHFVAVPAHTFIATWNAVISVGAMPVGIDVDKDGLMDLEAFSSVRQKVDAVIPVHMHGTAVNMAELNAICSGNKRVKIIEDASQAHGYRSHDGDKLGRYSEFVVYSLYPTKNLGALGDAGIVTTNIRELSDRLRSLSNYGQSTESKYVHSELGFNQRLDPIQAAILLVNSSMLNEWNQKRVELSHIYISELRDVIDILQLERTDSVRHHFCVLTPHRNELQHYLLSNGIKTEIHYPKVAGLEALKFMGKDLKFPISEKLAQQTLSLPLSQWHNSSQIEYVASKIRAWREP